MAGCAVDYPYRAKLRLCWVVGNTGVGAWYASQVAAPSGEQAELLAWFRGQVADLQEARRQRYSAALAERSASYVQVRTAPSSHSCCCQ